MSLRPRRFEYKRLGWALLISLLIHAFLYGGYQFTRNVLPVWMARVKFLAALAHQLQARQQKPPPPPHPTAVPLVFVEVNPQVATAEAPKDAKYYSSQNSKASDSSDKDTDTPQIDGQQDKVVKTEDAPRKFTPLQPSPAPKDEKTELAKKDKPAEKAKPKPPIGDLAMAKPTTELQRPDSGQDEHTRPRTITEARMRQQRNNNMMPGEKMKEEGGVRHHLQIIPSVDAKATPFGEYDRAFIEAVQQHWYDLLDDKNYAYDRTGKVTLQFRLTYDGRITDMTMQTTVGQTLGYLCELAVLDNVPYERWPSDMRHELGESRSIQFTFYY